ncbi:unnamed protein product [Anisakis simplex]|uniref:Uncharacterized protein n=1 Tax=Anisakis simplex TaxID=6269 RepID=A0A0M3JIN4_ANISI|nr:unnamed protein product [Anisakis simplex]
MGKIDTVQQHQEDSKREKEKRTAAITEKDPERRLTPPSKENQSKHETKSKNETKSKRAQLSSQKQQKESPLNPKAKPPTSSRLKGDKDKVSTNGSAVPTDQAKTSKERTDRNGSADPLRAAQNPLVSTEDTPWLIIFALLSTLTTNHF